MVLRCSERAPYRCNSGGPMSRTRRQPLHASVFDGSGRALRFPALLIVGLDFGDADPLAAVDGLFARAGIADPEELRARCQPPAEACLCRESRALAVPRFDAADDAALLRQVGDSLACFHNAMKALGLADAVTAFTQSDFGRTFTPNNSSGTDHAWGNHHLVIGGAVRGGTTYGSYPTLTLGGPDDVGVDSWELQGRWIPTLSVDQYAATLLAWFGATPAQLDAVLPNLKNFGSARSIGFL